MNSVRSGITLGEVITACFRYWYVLVATLFICVCTSLLLSQLLPREYTATVTSKVSYIGGVTPQIESTVAADFDSVIHEDGQGKIVVQSTGRDPVTASENAKNSLEFLSSLPALSDSDRVVFQEARIKLRSQREAVRGAYNVYGPGPDEETAKALESLFQLEDQLTRRILEIEGSLAAQSYIIAKSDQKVVTSTSLSLRKFLQVGLSFGALIGLILVGSLEYRRTRQK